MKAMHYAEMVAVGALATSAGISVLHYMHQVGMVGRWWPFSAF